MPTADTTAPKPTTTPPELNSGAAAMLIALERLLPDGALEDVAAAIARVADRETERRAEDAATRAAMEGELMELRAALSEALARADEAERRADPLDAEAARMRDALRQIARVSTDALAPPQRWRPCLSAPG